MCLDHPANPPYCAGEPTGPCTGEKSVREAANRLLEEFPKREIEPLLTRLEKLAESIDYNYLLDGLVRANQDFSRSFILPFSVPERGGRRYFLTRTWYTPSTTLPATGC